MPTVDLIAGGVVVAALAWGYWVGFGRAVVAAAFAAGAVGGALSAPLLLNEGQESSFALVFAVTGALLAGALLAALVERWTLGLRRRLRRMGVASSLAGALLAAAAGLAAVWLVAAALVQIDPLRDRVEDSEIVARLDTVVKPPGPSVPPEERPFDIFPIVEGPRPRIRLGDPKLVKTLPVRLADRRVVTVSTVTSCGTVGGTGWIGGDGIVVTNAHVAAASEVMSVKVQGFGEEHPATPVFFDASNDLALLRVPTLAGTQPLKIVSRPKEGTAGAIIGFPLGRHKIRAARIGATSTEYRGLVGPIPRTGFPRGLAGRLLTPFRGLALPGNSGGPIVDARGRVLTTVAIADGEGDGGYGVPNRLVRNALADAGTKRVSTGRCAMSLADAGRALG